MSTAKSRHHKILITMATLVVCICVMFLCAPTCLAAELNSGDADGGIETTGAMSAESVADDAADEPVLGEAPEVTLPCEPPEGLAMVACRANFPESLNGKNGWGLSSKEDNRVVMENVNGNILTMDETGVYLTCGTAITEVNTTDQFVYITEDVMPTLYSCPSLRFWQLDNMAAENGFVASEELADTELRKYVKVDGDMVYTVVVERDIITLHSDTLSDELPGAIFAVRCQVYGNIIWVSNADTLFLTEVSQPAQD